MIEDNNANSSDGENSSCIIISENEEDLDDLRQLALLSMIKKEKVDAEEKHISIITVYDIEKQLIEVRENMARETNDFSFKIDETSTFIAQSKRPVSETSSIDLKQTSMSDVEALVIDYVGQPLNVIKDKHLIYDSVKEMELKKRLIKMLTVTKSLEKSHFVNKVSNLTKYKKSPLLLTSNGNNNQNNPIEVDKFDSYDIRISNNKKSITEISRSIETMMNSINEKLQKSKTISVQIEELKRHKIDLHRDVNVTRSKILDLNKVKKQRVQTLAKYIKLKKEYELSPASSSNVDKSDSLSALGLDNEDYVLNVLDCNHIICPAWIDGTCVNTHCGYQHPRILVKPIKSKKAPTKENDKVFLPEMNPMGFTTKLHCEACSSRVLLPHLHIVEDWHCKSCCQQVMLMTKNTDIVRQLINIWHHLYKRFVMTKTCVAIPNSDATIIDLLLKCTQALQAKIISMENVSTDLFQTVGRHIVLTYSENCRTDDAVTFLRSTNYDTNLVLFSTKFSFPVHCMLQLVTDVIDHQIDKSCFDNFEEMVTTFCQWSSYVASNTVRQLLLWLEKIVKMNVRQNYGDHICVLTKPLLTAVIGSFDAHVLSLSLWDLQCDEHYWLSRRDLIAQLASIYEHDGATSSVTYLVLQKFRILSLFNTDNEESAIELFRTFSHRHFYFTILLSKLSLKYNYPVTMDDCGMLFIVEHTYNKSEWLLRNRSQKSCVKILENVLTKVYKVNTNPCNPLSYFAHFLGLESHFDAIISNVELKLSNSDAKMVRKTSSIWMCYVTLSYLQGNVDGLLNLLHSDALLSLDVAHLSRVVHLILGHFSVIYSGSLYQERIKTSLMRIEKLIDFDHFMELVKVISFDKLGDCQLSMWLFLLDFCLAHYVDEGWSTFLTEMSLHLSSSGGSCAVNYVIFSHIMLCYPIRVEKVWLHFIDLILALGAPIYELMDACATAVSLVRSSQSLWRHYYNCAIKGNNTEMITNIKETALKIGYHFE